MSKPKPRHSRATIFIIVMAAGGAIGAAWVWIKNWSEQHAKTKIDYHNR